MLKKSSLLLVFALVSCTNINNPSSVADKFWKALSEKNLEKAKKHAVIGSIENTTLFNNSELQIVEIAKKARFENELAYVPVKIDLQKNGEKKSYEFDTVLTKENNLWKVDFDKTKTEMFGYSAEQFEKSIKKAGREMGEAIGQAVKEMGRAVGEAVEDMTEKTKDAIEKHRK